MERFGRAVIDETEVVPVSMYPLYEEVRKLESLLNQESLIDDDAMVLRRPDDPM